MSEEPLFSLRTDVALVPAGSPATRHILVTLTAPEAPRPDSRGATVPGCPPARPSIHVSFVLDRSGSMGGSKIRLARDAVRQALQMLRADDRFALVASDDPGLAAIVSRLRAVHFAAYSVAHSRAADGKAKRKADLRDLE